MPSISLPWIAGPVPILATIWSAYVTTEALVYRRAMSGERFVAAFLFPLGFVALISLMFLKTYDLPVLVTVGQFATALCFAGIFVLEKHRHGGPLFPMAETTTRDLSWMLYFGVIIYIIYCILVYTFPISEACTNGKCHALELLLGRKEYGFSVLYSASFIGSAMLALILLILFQIITRIKPHH
ncbi:hypothetical protein NMA58_07530 [Rhizobium sp. YTUHZ045]|uniref:hypothetical protein n=1 Tax=Rhizobium sp. YTUHZ045 TaxID=2962888 RepID=UPI003DA89AB1